MNWPMFYCVTVKKIIYVVLRSAHLEHRTSVSLIDDKQRWRWSLFTRVSHVSYDPTMYIPFLPINQTSISRIANQPVVDVTLEQYLSANVFPLREVYGIVICFIQRRLCRDRHIRLRLHWPWRSRCDCVRCVFKWHVIGKCIAICQGPASSISVHVAVSLERVGLGSTVRINPINTRGGRRRLVAESLTRGNCRWLSGTYMTSIF